MLEGQYGQRSETPVARILSGEFSFLVSRVKVAKEVVGEMDG